MTEHRASIATRVVKPHECVLAFGIPTSESNFRNDLRRSDKDFAKRFNGLWARYESEFVSVLDSVEPVLRSIGVEVVHNLALSQLRPLTATPRVFVLFSHWFEGRVEFSDGLHDVALVAESVDPGFTGILDLCVCRSESLAVAVRSNRGCLVRHVAAHPGADEFGSVASSEVTPRYWLFFFMVLFKHLAQTETTYLAAVEDVVREFLKRPGAHK